MKLYDQHLHSRFSFDCRTDPRANVESAIDRGLAGLTFTEHFDTHPEDWKTCVYDHDAYTAEIEKLRAQYGSQIFIGQGIEICFQRDRMDYILSFLELRSFDLVILSVHYFGGAAVHKRAEWEGITVEEGTRRYFEKLVEAARFVEELQAGRDRVFDVLGHLDLVKRYTQRFFGEHDVEACGDLRDEALARCIAADLTPEINTSTLRQGLTETMPGPITVKRYADLGGRAMSIGSDAHRAEDIAADFDRAVEMLRDAGIPTLAVFKERQRQLIDLGRCADSAR